MITLQEALRAVFYSPFYATLERRAFEAEGVEVRFVSAPEPGRALDGLMDGSVDVGWGGPMRTNLGNETMPGADVVCFAEVVTRDPFFLMTMDDRGVFGPQNLAGMRLGSVSEVPTPWLCLQHDMRLAGVDPESVVRTKGNTMAQNVAALKAGTIDVAQVFQPYAEQLIEDGARIWYAQADRGPCSYTTFYARRPVLHAKHKELGAMVRALQKTVTWVHSVEGAELAALVKPYFPDVPEPQLAKALSRYKKLGIWGRDLRLPRAGYDRLRDSLVSGGLVKRGIPYEDAVDNSLAEAARNA
jgi:NitT/TauT family transport system substrate-binding protein